MFVISTLDKPPWTKFEIKNCKKKMTGRSRALVLGTGPSCPSVGENVAVQNYMGMSGVEPQTRMCKATSLPLSY